MPLMRLAVGRRFRCPEMDNATGVLLKCNECRALVRWDRPPVVHDFETPDGKWKRIISQAEPQSITPYLEIVPL